MSRLSALLGGLADLLLAGTDPALAGYLPEAVQFDLPLPGTEAQPGVTNPVS